MTVDLPNYQRCEVFAEEKLVMFSDESPKIDFDKSNISFPKMTIFGAFLAEYLGTDFVIKIFENGSDKPTITCLDAGIMKMGKLELISGDYGACVVFDSMEFQYDQIKDVHERFMGDIEENDDSDNFYRNFSLVKK